MTLMGIVVFYLSSGAPAAETFGDVEFPAAIARAEQLRKLGKTHVIMSMEHADQVGKSGVDSVENGKTPDGHDYEWSKKHRGSGPVTSS